LPPAPPTPITFITAPSVSASSNENSIVFISPNSFFTVKSHKI
jgi:hypothetical protein